MNIFKEDWRPIPNQEFYEVSNHGNVRSVDRLVKHSNGHMRTCRGQLLKRNITKYGYEDVALCADGSMRKFYVHRLVLLAFVGPPEENEEGSHLDGDRLNNRLDNLAWETRSENCQRKRDHGTLQDQRGESNPSAKLTGRDVDDIRRRLFEGESQSAVAERFGISQSHVSDIARGKRWSHR